MATAAPATAEKKPLPGKKADGEPRPPSDSVWLRYSKHGEFPLSTTASFAIHALVIGLLIVLGLFVFGKRKENTPPVDVVRYNVGKGQGRGAGAGNGVGDGIDTESGAGHGDGSVEKGPPDEGPLRLDFSKIPDHIRNDPNAARAIKNGNPNIVNWSQINETARNKMRTGLNPGGNGGQGVGGMEGGTSGDGDGKGPGGPLSKREQRMFRWRIEFDHTSPALYLAQLGALKAIIGVPVGDGKSYRAIRDVSKRPATVLGEDPMTLGLIAFFNNDPGWTVACMRTLGIKEAPAEHAVFFPRELEMEFAKAEVGYRGLPEEKIEQTFFRLVPSGRTLKPVVIKQIEKP